MLGSFKGKPLDQPRSGTTPSDITPTTPDTPTPDTPTRDIPEAISAIGSGMTIVGKIVCDGVLHIFGRIEGELRATNVLIADRANVQGDVIADELTVEGDLKGTIYATRVRIRGTGSVQGDIFHQSLAIEENAQFEGMSRRQDNSNRRSNQRRSNQRRCNQRRSNQRPGNQRGGDRRKRAVAGAGAGVFHRQLPQA